MAQYNRPPRVKPPKPDEFISFFDRVVRYFLIHQNKFYLLIAAVALGFAGYGLYLYKASRDAHNFAAAYWEAEQTPESQASQTWENLLKQSPPGHLPELIRLQWGGDLGRQNKWAEAAKAFQANDASSSTLLKELSRLSQAIALENSGQWQPAYDLYSGLAELKGSPLQSEARLGMARSLSGLGKDDEAETILLQLIVKGSDAPQAVKSAALNRLVAIKAKAPESAPSP